MEAAATDAAIHKNMFRSGFTTLIISNGEINDIMKIAKSLEESGSLIKGVSETIKNDAKNKKWGFHGILLGTLVAILRGKGITTAGEGTIRAGKNFYCHPIL